MTPDDLREMPESVWVWDDGTWSTGKDAITCSLATAYVRADRISPQPAMVTAKSFINNTAGVIGEDNADYIIRTLQSNFPNGIRITPERGDV